MHEVAGRVGHLLTELFMLRLSGLAGRRGRMMPLARDFGLALQTVNVIRGLHEDRDRGWVYVPTEFIPDPGPRPSELFEPGNHEAAMSVLARLVRKAERHLGAARDYIRMIPRRHHGVRLFCQLPLFFAVRTPGVEPGQPGRAPTRDENDAARGARGYPEREAAGVLEPVDGLVLRAAGRGRLRAGRGRPGSAAPARWRCPGGGRHGC